MRSIIVELLSYYHLCAMNIMYIFFSLLLSPARLQRHTEWHHGLCHALREKPQFVLSLMSDVEKASKMILEKLA